MRFQYLTITLNRNLVIFFNKCFSFPTLPVSINVTGMIMILERCPYCNFLEAINALPYDLRNFIDLFNIKKKEMALKLLLKSIWKPTTYEIRWNLSA